MRIAVAVAASLLALPSAAEDLQSVAERGAVEIATALRRAPTVKRIAMLPFTDGGAAKGAGAAAESIVAARLARAGVADVVDREKLTAILGEQKLQAMLGSGKTGPDPQLLDRSGAQAVLTGQLSDAGDRALLQLRLVSATGAVLGQFHGTADLPGRETARTSPRAPESIDVAMRRLTDGLAAGFARMPGSSRYRRLAVLTFGETGPEAQRQRLGQIVTAEVATGLRRDHGLLLVERAKLNEVMSELKLQQMATPTSSQAGQIGNLAEAQALVIGQVNEVGDRFLVNARIVATESGETLSAESTTVSSTGMVAFAKDAVVLRSRSDALFRSLLLPGLGQLYNRQPVKGWFFLGTEVALLGSALAFHVAGNREYARYQDVGPAPGTSPSQEASHLYDVASQRYRTRDYLLVGAAVVWAANAVDAWVSGVDGEKLLSGSAAVIPTVVPVDGGALAVASVRF
jgi:TolB-like protein